MPRVTDANILFSGSEPKYSVELTSSELMQTLSWYAQNKVTKDAVKYACDYFKKFHKLDASTALKNKVATFGFVCRIITNGGSLPSKDKVWFDAEVQKVKEDLQTNLSLQPSQTVVKTNVISIQDRIRDKANECIAELESQVDDFVLSGCSANVSPYGIFHTMNIKDAQTKYINEWAKSKRIEFDDVLNTDDPLIKEGYSNFTKPQLKKLIGYFDQVILDCQKLSGDSVKSRKPRKRKAKSPEQLVSKLKYMYEFPDLKLKSIKPNEVIGCMSLWIYNTKTRKLGVYHADDAGGLSVKGSSILNYTESKSVQKKLRKPEVTLPEVLNGGKVFLRNVMDGIRAVESNLTGRINSDTILLKVTK
jgi:hypothetical protein